jgi:hypothetical protein
MERGRIPTLRGGVAMPRSRDSPDYAPVKADEIEEVDAPFTVNWEAPPDPKLAKKYHETLMARCHTEEVNGEQVRDVLDVAAGYEAINDEDIGKWPLWGTTRDELGKIGGAGALVYFELLYRLPIVFGIMALLNTPNLYLNLYGEDNMYDSELLTRQYKTWSARTTLGSVKEPTEMLDSESGFLSGHAGAMWVRTLLDACSVALFLYFIIGWKQLRKHLTAKADAAACSMADYTVSVRPKNDWPDPFDRSLDDDDRQKKFIEDLRNHMEDLYGPVAVIDGKPAIWLAFSERKVIQLSKVKCDQLVLLEEALSKAAAKDWVDETLNAAVEKVAAEVRVTNREMDDLRVAKVTAVEAFVTFESHLDAEKAIADSDNFGNYKGQTCKLTEVRSSQPASQRAQPQRRRCEKHCRVLFALIKCMATAFVQPPEPESLHWDRLPIQPTEQAIRKYSILTATIVLLFSGFFGVIQAGTCPPIRAH